MKNKKKVLTVCDASFVNTGYGIYSREILSRLHKHPDYEVAELACFTDSSNPENKKIPWKFYPNAVPLNDSRINEYRSNSINVFGSWRFNRCLADFAPNIVFDIRDFWMFSYQENSPYKKYFNWVIMPATDSAPPKAEWLYTFSNADIVMPYTDWAKKVLTESCGKTINLFPKIANAGINPEEFYPIENKKQHKINFFGEDVSIVGAVMRNQKRKLFPDLMLAYKKYLENIKNSNQELYDKSYLYLHTSYPEDNGWDIPALLLEYGLLDKTYFTYICRDCKKFFPSKFQGSISYCKNCNKGSCTFSGSSFGVDTNQLNLIYNFFDLFVQYAICEGFGMPQVEAAACGIPIASVDYSSMTEIAEKLDGYKIPVQRMFRELETNADRVYPDIEHTAKLMFDFFINLSDEHKKQKSIETRKRCLDIYTWDKVYEVWLECFDNIDINSKKSWSSEPMVFEKNIKVPKDLDDESFVSFICNYVIKNPDLLKTAAVQSLIKDLNLKLVAKNGSVSSFNRQQAIQVLESYLNNEISCDQMRLNRSIINKEDFIK
jgi:glycosyltransferase involved in cell wall biosynthesis